MKKSQMVSLRLDPRMRYLAGLAAKRQHITLTEFIHRAIEQAFHAIPVARGLGSIADYGEWLYDFDEITRFVRLAHSFEDLLDRDELLIWKVIRDNKYFWNNEPWTFPVVLEKPLSTGSRHPPPVIRTPSPDIEKIRKHWKQIIAVAREDAPPDTLPALETDDTPEQPPVALRKTRSKAK